ncbi:hypothetical protein OG241_08190 [Streptomyces sp. NBC_01390]|uniref:hypothetical protein n=1 Tax=Streptomyces sp. NBC_01390 TaxID=2903850 RepID=UPI003243907A
MTLRPGWNTGMRIWAMRRVLMAKFAVPGLSQRLVATGDLMLVEKLSQPSPAEHHALLREGFFFHFPL